MQLQGRIRALPVLQGHAAQVQGHAAQEVRLALPRQAAHDGAPEAPQNVWVA